MAAKNLVSLLGLDVSQPGTLRDQDQLLQNTVGILDVFANCFVELRRGLDQFSNELAIKAFSEKSGLHTANTGKEVLSYLVSGNDPKNRIAELTCAFADIMIHQVALLTGISEGVRSLLRRFDPYYLMDDLAANPERVFGIPIRKGIWPFSVTALWQRFKQLHASLVEDDQAVSQVLFGDEFAQSYDAAKMRHNNNNDDPHKKSPRAATPKKKNAK